MNTNYTMESIIKRDNFTIWRDQSKSIFKIEFKYTAYSLINSLIKSRIIQGASTDENYRTLKFKAQSVKTLRQFQDANKVINGHTKFTIANTAKLIQSLTQQLEYMITHDTQTIIGYTPEEIIVINDVKFAFLGSELIANIDFESNSTIMISCPFSTKDFFVSPELLEIKELPAYIHYKTSYFSLACLAIHLLLDDNNEFYYEYVKHKQPEIILDKLDTIPIKYTRLYWLLSRCLVENPSERSILLI